MRLTDFGMDTITLAGPLEAKLRAMQAKLTGEQEKLQQLINTLEGQ